MGIAVVPKSSNPERVKENLEALDFVLEKEDVEKLKNLDQNKRGQDLKFAKSYGYLPYFD